MTITWIWMIYIKGGTMNKKKEKIILSRFGKSKWDDGWRWTLKTIIAGPTCALLILIGSILFFLYALAEPTKVRHALKRI